MGETGTTIDLAESLLSYIYRRVFEAESEAWSLAVRATDYAEAPVWAARRDEECSLCEGRGQFLFG